MARVPPRVARVFWRVVNPLARPLAGFLPFWVLLETTGHRTGRVRRTPLASGPGDDTGMWLIAVHGRHSAWVRNAERAPSVRLRHRGRCRAGRFVVEAWDPDVVRRFNPYARGGPGTFGLDPLLIRIVFERIPAQEDT